MKKPVVFVSSTCLDLAEVRDKLKCFIEELGYEALVSESETFPVSPEAGTLDNCLNVVRQRADLLVLVVATRYGSTPSGDKSVTHLEYLTARAKGIPNIRVCG